METLLQTIEVVLLAKSAAEKLPVLLEITKTIEGRIEDLERSAYRSGIVNLQQALRSSVDQESLLREARNKFVEATTLEKGSRLALSYLHLAQVHFLLGDQANYLASLEALLAVKPAKTFASMTRGLVKDQEQRDLYRLQVSVARGARLPFGAVAESDRSRAMAHEILFELLQEQYGQEVVTNPNNRNVIAELEYYPQARPGVLIAWLQELAEREFSSVVRSRLRFEAARMMLLYGDDTSTASRLLELASGEAGRSRVSFEIPFYTLALAKDWSAVNAFMKRSLRELPSPADQSYLYFHLGVVSERFLGQTDKALKLYANSLALDDDNLASRWSFERLEREARARLT